MERTQEQILTLAPIVIVLAGKEYPVPILTIGKAIAWRQKLISTADDIMRPLMQPIKPPLWKRAINFLAFWRPKQSGTADSVFAGLGTAWIAFPEKVLQLIFDYAPDLPRQEIRETATEEEMFVAFSKIVDTVNPLRRQISLMKAVTANLRPSEKSMSSSSPSMAATPAG
jgi:hypothetical protein